MDPFGDQPDVRSATPAVQRLLDANLNRAREALRVCEDYARFLLDDAAAAAELKALRHALTAVRASLDVNTSRPAAAGLHLPGEAGLDDSGAGGSLLAARDVGGDVGREIKTESELRRADARQVVAAAFARFGEAARSLGEYGKLVDAQAAAECERLRYLAYELEQVLLARGDLRQQMRAVRLYVIITGQAASGDWLAAAEAALRGGARCLQLREKTLSDGELLRRAARLRELTRRHGALLIINDRPDIALLAHADGVHVGQEDLPVAAVRRVVGADRLVGKSTHTAAQLEAALAERPDYVAVGPMFASMTKPGVVIAGPGLAEVAVRRTELPVVAIGGITAENVGQVRAAGVKCVCACAGVVGTQDVEQAARRLATAD